jgi:glutamyl-Q tRNA(Asp) synthetase
LQHPVAPFHRPAYRGRFAPSPSGPLHLGSLFTALASFLEARSQGGEWLVRIDDIDPYRTLPGAADRILSSLESLGLTWDRSVVHQSHRLERYRAGLDALKDYGLVYACDCSRRELADERTNSSPGVYPGYCRHKRLPHQAANQALRLITDEATVRFDDRLLGPVEQALSRDVGDFIVYRRDEVFAYHLATVIDDAEQGITDVVRGRDLLDSTPRQIYLQQRLNLPTPDYAHVPVLLNADGQKMSKRTLAAEAETRYPGRVLSHLLGLLQHPLPTGMEAAATEEILDWAIRHWQLARLRDIDSMVPEPFQLSP